jgi:hypothetical protein
VEYSTPDQVILGHDVAIQTRITKAGWVATPNDEDRSLHLDGSEKGPSRGGKTECPRRESQVLDVAVVDAWTVLGRPLTLLLVSGQPTTLGRPALYLDESKKRVPNHNTMPDAGGSLLAIKPTLI